MKQGQSLPFRRVYTGLPVYNGERYLKASVLSHLSQTFDDFRSIITDNISIDCTREINQPAANQGPRVIYRRNAENVGAAGNYTKCFEPSNGESFRWLSSDDASRDFWDRSKQRLSMQHWRRVATYYLAVRRAPQAAKEKRRIYEYLTKMMYWTKGELFAERANYLRFGFPRSL